MKHRLAILVALGLYRCGAPDAGVEAASAPRSADVKPSDVLATVADAPAGPDAAAPADSGPAPGGGEASDAFDIGTADGAPGLCPAECPKPASPCQHAACEPAVGCIVVALPDKTLCDDGNACTAGSVCTVGICVGGPVHSCDDANPCTQDTCNAKSGNCAHLPAEGTATTGPACDDGDACTVESVCQGGACQGGLSICPCQASATCAALDDGNLCNGSLYCDPASATCTINPATVVKCADDGLPCTDSVCAPATGKCSVVNLADTATCTDGAPCTEGDHCSQGKCEPGTNVCCSSAADCAKQEDGNLCNGTLFCNQATGKCQVNPTTLVYCPSAGDTACQHNQCDAKLGLCQFVFTADGGACDDGNPCTQSACQDGGCVASVNTCSCQNDGDCAKKEDGNLCNGTLFCNLATKACEVNPATVVACGTGADNACAKNTCAPATGVCALAAQNSGAGCDADGNPCTGPDMCVSGVCKAGSSVCSCQSNADCATQEDGDPCNGTLYCDQIAHACKVNPATLVVCPSGLDTACTHSACNPQTAQCEVKPINGGGLCDADGSPCTADQCQGGACVQGANLCQCQLDADCKALDDSNLCNGSLYCDKKSSKCVVNLSTIIPCAPGDDTDCAHRVCQPKTGKCAVVPFNEFGPCGGDANPCTVGDRCQTGVCVVGLNQCQCGTDQGCGVFQDANLCNGSLVCSQAGDTKSIGLCVTATATVIQCAGGGACLASVCQAKTGKCIPTAINAGKGCDDGVTCTGGDQCQGGVCIGTQPGCDDGEPCTLDVCDVVAQACKHVPALCGDNNPCTADSCSPGVGCLNVPQAGGCDDANLCTLGDTCDKGKCVSGSKVQNCDDGFVCTLDACSPTAGCVHQGAAGTCSDGNPCTLNDACSNGACLGKDALDCSDGNACTADPCKTGLGCVHLAQDATCSDSNPCTQGDKCSGGKCAGTSEVDCGDGNPCTADVCAIGKGCVHAVQEVSCDDGNPCTAGDACQGAACLPGTATVNCDDGTPCTLDVCSTVKGCVHAAASGACNDSNPCTMLDQCQQGVCLGPNSLLCDDGNACSADSCAPTSGCVNLPQDATCSDGNPCTLGDKCAGSSCKAGVPVSCDDGDFCTNDACSAAKGCVHTFNQGPCEDGAYCTTGDSCDGQGSCVGTARDCQAEVGSLCTAGKCDEAADKCAALPYADGTGCDDGVDCTPLDLCSAGKCEGSGDACGDELFNVDSDCTSAPGIAATAGGGFVVQWTGSGNAVSLRAADAHGSKIAEEVRLDDIKGETFVAPRPVFDGDKVYAMYWHGSAQGSCSSGIPSSPSTDGGVRVARLNLEGAVLSKTKLFNAFTPCSDKLAGNYSYAASGCRYAPVVSGDGKFGALGRCFLNAGSFGKLYNALASGREATAGSSVAPSFVQPAGLFGAALLDATPAPELGNDGWFVGATDDQSGLLSALRHSASLDGFVGAPFAFSKTHCDVVGSCQVSRALRAPDGGLWALVVYRDAGKGVGDIHLYRAQPATLASSKTVVTANLVAEENADGVVFADESMLVAWSAASGDGSGWAIRGRRYDKDAKPLTDELTLNDTTQGDQRDPALAALPNEDVAMAFRSGAGKLYVRRLTHDGKATGVRLERIANQVTEGDQANVVAASQSDGARAMLVWNGPIGGKDGLEVRGRVFDKNGKPLGNEFAVNATSVDNQVKPAIAASSARFAVVWDSQGQDGQLDGIVGRVFDVDGNPVTPEVVINQTTLGIQDTPAVAMNDSGIWYVAWHDYDPTTGFDRIFGRAFDKGGVALGDEKMLNTLKNNGDIAAERHEPTVAALAGTAEFVVAQETHYSSTPWSIAINRVSVAGKFAVGAPWYLQSGFDLRRPRLLGTATGVTLCFQENSIFLPYLCGKLAATGTSLSGAGKLVPKAVYQAFGEQSNLALAPLPGGEIAAAWQTEGVDGSGAAVMLRKFAANQVTEAGLRVQANRTQAGDQRGPAVAWLQGGTLTAWTSDGQDGSGASVVYRVLPQ